MRGPLNVFQNSESQKAEPVNEQGTEKVPQTMVSESDDIQKWEMEVENMVDKKCHELMGESYDNATGTWIDDPARKTIMNEYGASEFKNEITARVFLNMQMSDLDERWIIKTYAKTGKIYSNKLEDNWESWGVEPKHSNMESVAQQLVDMLSICLMIAKNQGMRRHRERRGQTTVYQPQSEVGVM